MPDNTVFDSVFKTMMQKTPRLIVPFINEAFGRSYALDDPILRIDNEHEGPLGKNITDSMLRLGDKIYHIECQSTPETDMVVRMVEYDFAIALEEAIRAGAPYEMNFPESCVLFLRHTSKTPEELQMKVNLPSGESFMYASRVVKAQRFSSDDIFERGLLLLLPYYLMRYEGRLSEIDGDDVRTSELVAECAELRAGLESETLAKGDSLLYEQLVELIIKVTDHLLAKHETLRRKVRRTMGGEVLELMRERAERLEREAEERGREQGVEQGLAEGREQGLEQGIDALASQLRARGIDENVIEEAMAAARKQ